MPHVAGLETRKQAGKAWVDTTRFTRTTKEGV